MKVRLVREIQTDSIVDGSGIRAVLWFQGCSHNCEGCHNPYTHDFNAGIEYDLEDVKKMIDDLEFQNGVTLSGGDPLFQIDAACEIAKYIKERNLNVWVYTGFTYEDILKNDKLKKILNYIDILVDGKFVLSLKSLNCKFRGSSNQRLIDVQKSIEEGSIVLYNE